MTNKYYQKSKEKLRKKHVIDLKIFLKKKKTKDEKIVLKKYQNITEEEKMGYYYRGRNKHFSKEKSKS